MFAEIRVAQHPDPDRRRGKEHRRLEVGDVLQDLTDVRAIRTFVPPTQKTGFMKTSRWAQ